MKHFQDEDPEDWEGSVIARHWRDKKDNEDSDDWEGSAIARHWREDY